MEQDHIGGSPSADHLCVLVHGLWGNPDHMVNIAKNLRARYSRDELYLLLAKSNSGNFTYDGIERGGERVSAEIEQEIRDIEKKGTKIKKLSIIGYSLGGLVARYAVGMLHVKGVLDTVECQNFTTFASPHLGVRSPLKGWYGHLFNVIGANTLSKSGHQLFTIDKFRDTKRPLLAVMTDPDSIFIAGLRKFKRHTLYNNITNDRSAVYYTTGIHKTNPYTDLEKIKVNYLKGWEDVILDPLNPVDSSPKPQLSDPATMSTMTKRSMRRLKRVPLAATFAVLLPVGVVAYLLASVVATVRSSNRIKLHETGKGGLSIEEYRVPVFIKGLRGEVEHAYETLNSSQGQDYLGAEGSDDDMPLEQRTTMRRERRMSMPSQPTLALKPEQFEMIESLDTLGWRKYPIWIHKHRHSHAAIIARMDKEVFEEGYRVLKHFAEEEFLA